jgi:hypothetical protein
MHDRQRVWILCMCALDAIKRRQWSESTARCIMCLPSAARAHESAQRSAAAVIFFSAQKGLLFNTFQPSALSHYCSSTTKYQQRKNKPHPGPPKTSRAISFWNFSVLTLFFILCIQTDLTTYKKSNFLTRHIACLFLSQLCIHIWFKWIYLGWAQIGAR